MALDCGSPDAKKAKWSTANVVLHAVLPEKYRASHAETVDYWALVVQERKKISGLLSLCVEHYALQTEHEHLKRVHVVDDVALILVTPVTVDFDRKLFPEHDFRRVAVPAHRPLTRAQYETERTLWPCKFKACARLEQQLNDTLFSAVERDAIADDLRRLYELIGDDGDTANACMIVNPASGGQPRTVATAVVPSTDEYRPLDHAVVLAINRTSEMLLADDNSSQYLCTGFYCYSIREPCVMCAMALVHSRILAVFYVEENAAKGAFGSKCLLHCNPALNHNFDVYRVSWSET